MFLPLRYNPVTRSPIICFTMCIQAPLSCDDIHGDWCYTQIFLWLRILTWESSQSPDEEALSPVLEPMFPFLLNTLWVAPTVCSSVFCTNLIAVESLVRLCLYGYKYYVTTSFIAVIWAVEKRI
jgi:hypothetical protein